MKVSDKGAMRMGEHILKCERLTKRFGSKEALCDITIELSRGKIVGLLGPNGSGKTTLIKTANGLLTPSMGKIIIDGLLPGYETKKKISYLPDRSALDEAMKVKDIVGMFSDFYDDFSAERAYELLADLKIDPEDKLKTLSKGNKEKVQLILVMSRSAELYLLDEPIGGVDPATRDYILETIVKNRAANATVVISTHLIADVEQILDEVIFIKDGKIVLYESVEDLRSREGKSIDEIFREVFRC